VTERRWRVITAVCAIAAAVVLLHGLEQYRAVRTPDGWKGSQVVDASIWRPRIANSRWVLAPGSRWTADTAADQWFLRAHLSTESELTVRHGPSGPGIQLGLGQVPLALGAEDHDCSGELLASKAGVVAVIFTRTQDGYIIKTGKERLACTAAVGAASPQLAVDGGAVELISIGADEQNAGVPLSVLGWLGGVALVGFLWMMLLEIERVRGVKWPVVIATGSLCVPAAALLWIAPAANVAGLPLAWILVLATIGLKALTIATGTSRATVTEE